MTMDLTGVFVDKSDTHVGMEVTEFKEILLALGFVQVFKSEFGPRPSQTDMPRGKTDEFQVWYDKDRNCLVTMDTNRHDFVNSANYYFNWQANFGIDVFRYLNSGLMLKEVPNAIAGFDTALRGLRKTLWEMDAHGTWLNPWNVFPTSMWMEGHGEEGIFSVDYRDPVYSERDFTPRWLCISEEIRKAINWSESRSRM